LIDIAKSLQRAGYATDPAYAEKLTRAIRMVSGPFANAAPPARAIVAQAAPAQDPARLADSPSDSPA